MHYCTAPMWEMILALVTSFIFWRLDFVDLGPVAFEYYFQKYFFVTLRMCSSYHVLICIWCPTLRKFYRSAFVAIMKDIRADIEYITWLDMYFRMTNITLVCRFFLLYERAYSVDCNLLMPKSKQKIGLLPVASTGGSILTPNQPWQFAAVLLKRQVTTHRVPTL